MTDTTFSEVIFKAHATSRASIVPEKRLTLAPVYSPNRVDAHNEWTTPDALEEAVIDFAKNGSKRLLLQHGVLGAHTVGDIIAVFTLPWQITCKMTTPSDGKVRKMTFPEHTCWMWVRWDRDSWPLVKSGKITGYSMGGRAVRVETPGVRLPDMGDKVLAKAGRVLSQKNVEDLRNLIAVITALIARDPHAAAEQGMAKSADGVLLADEENQVVWHLHMGGVELLTERS